MARIIPLIDATGNEGTVNEGDDLRQSVKRKLGDYLKSKVDDPTIGKKNSDDRQYTTQTRLADHDNTTFFHSLEGADFNELQSVLDANIRSSIGHEDILAAIEGAASGPTPTDDARSQPSEEAGVVVGSVSKVLSQNRFNPTATFGDNFTDNGIIAVMPTTLGSYDATGAPATLDSLKKVGMSLMLRATGEFIDGDPTNPGISLASLLPGQAQLGLKVPFESLRAENTFGAPGRDPGAGRPRQRVKDIVLGNLGEHTRSYGNLNSYNEPFDGFLPLGMTGLAIVLVVALRLIATGFIRLLGLIASKPLGKKKPSVDPLEMGSYGRKTKGGFISLSDIGIVELDRNFIACSEEGLKVFFSFDGQSFGRVARSPGFYANMVRVIVQSAARIITSVTDAFRKLASGSLLAGAQAILGIADILKTSKVIAFLNIMAILGDRAFARREKKIDDHPRHSIVDGIPLNERSRIMKNRVKDGNVTTLAWRNASTFSALLLPDSITHASRKFNNTTTPYRKIRRDWMKRLPANPGSSDHNSGRFTPDEVADMEQMLDSEYVPFYFHDLRTNEIVSFHAFIASVNESFSPSYNESNPYGRVDPIMTYSNTRREFSLSFHVVSTSPDDMDAMYMKLNKLSTLLYPQFTKGRQVVDAGGNKFTQPFSQQIGASPVCRIRLGNLMKTNFSNPALGRLFGLGEKEFLDGKVDKDALFSMTYNTIKKQIETAGWAPGQLATLLPADFRFVDEHEGITSSITDKGVLSNINRAAIGPQLVRVILPGVTSENYQGVEEKVVQVKFESPGLSALKPFAVPASLLQLSAEEIESKIPPTSVDIPGLDDQRDFFKQDNNSIVRSFRNVQGKGLAGVITSLSMDWNEAAGRWDTERFSARVPTLVKIDLSFTVIHDIPPGLDADGMNRAPIWPAGDAMMGMWGDGHDESGKSRDYFDKLTGKIWGK